VLGADASLLARAREGDLEAFASFVQANERRVRALLARLLDDDRDVDEAAQDTFVQAWRSLDGFRGDAAPFTWLYRIATNEALQRLRKQRRDTQPLEIDPAARGMDDEFEAREVSSFITERLRALPVDERAAVVLRDVEGLSNGEVADVLGVSIAAAKSRIHRGRMRLRADLARWREARL
jgi:RNA polymerase sigma-70 factor (ECF subfamily)